MKEEQEAPTEIGLRELELAAEDLPSFKNFNSFFIQAN